MADGITLPLTGAGDATAVAATDDTGATGHVQIIKIAVSANGDITLIPADGTFGLGADVKRIVPGTGATNLGKAEDAVAASGDTAVPILAVRRDAASSGVGTDGDYAMISVDSNGALRVVGSTSATEYTEDAASTADPTGAIVIARRRDTLTVSEVSADGDNIAANATSKGQLHVYSEIGSVPAANRLSDHVGAAQMTDAVMNGLTALTPKFAVIDNATSGDNTLVAAVSTKKIRVLSAFLVAAAAVNVRFESGAGGTALTGQMNVAANGGFVLPFNPVGWFETAATTLLNLELSGATSCDGSLTYVEV